MMELAEVRDALNASGLSPRRWSIERLGGNVYAVTDWDVTVTINGGQLAADLSEDTADVLVCRDGAAIGACEVPSLSMLVALVGSVR